MVPLTLLIAAPQQTYPQHMHIFGRFRENRRIRELEERLETAERDLKRLRLEWEDAYDKLRAIMGRLNKRVAREREESEADEHPEGEIVVPQTNSRGGPGGGLSDRQRLIQQQILRRRAGL